MAERKHEITRLLAALRDGGAGSVFQTIAPDDVHDKRIIALTFPFTGYDNLPNNTTKFETDVLNQLRAPSPADRRLRHPKMDETSLQKRVGDNGIAVAVGYKYLMNGIHRYILRVDNDRKTDKPLRERIPGIHGILHRYIEMYETNMRGSGHAHGQGTGGLAPQLIADAAEFDCLYDDLITAVNSHYSTELELEYVAVLLAQKVLGLAKRRDAAASLTTEYHHHGKLTAANRHEHVHEATCLKGKHGIDGCRLNMNAAHGYNTRVAQLYKVGTDDVVIDDKLFCPYCSTQRGKRTIEEDVQRRGLHYSIGSVARKPFHLRNLMSIREETDDDDDERDDVPPESVTLSRFAGPPDFMFETKDERALVVDLGRRSFMVPEDDKTVSALQQALLDSRAEILKFEDDACGDSERQQVLRDIIQEGQPLYDLLQKPGIELVRARLEELATKNLTEPKDIIHLRELLSTWTSETTACFNSHIVDYNPVLAAATGSNAVPLTLGAGVGAKGVAMYQIKYMVKEGDMIEAFASILIDAHQRVRDYKSSAPDSGTTYRTSLHEAQRIHNTAEVELSLAVACNIIMNFNSSFHTHTTKYTNAWEHAKLALKTDSSHNDDDSEGDYDEEDDEYDDDSEGDYDEENNEYEDDQTDDDEEEVEPDDDEEKLEIDKEDEEPEEEEDDREREKQVKNEESEEHKSYEDHLDDEEEALEVFDDDEDADIDKEDEEEEEESEEEREKEEQVENEECEEHKLHDDNFDSNDSVGIAQTCEHVAGLKDDPKTDKELFNIVEVGGGEFDNSIGSVRFRKRCNPITGEIEVENWTDAETYAYRDKALAYVTAREFHAHFDIRSSDADRKYLEEKRKKKKKDAAALEIERTRVAYFEGLPTLGAGDSQTENTNSNNVDKSAIFVDTLYRESLTMVEKKRGRPSLRYEIRAPHALSLTHVIVRKEKACLLALAGNPPPKYNRDPGPRRKCWAMYFSAHFRPWILTDNVLDKPDLSYDGFVEYYHGLEVAACLYGPRGAMNDGETNDSVRERLASKMRDEKNDESDDDDSYDHVNTHEALDRLVFEAHASKVLRTVAFGRLYAINTFVTALEVPKETASLLGVHRRRGHSLWEDTRKPLDMDIRDTISGKSRVLAELKKQHEHNEKMKHASPLSTRLNESQNAAIIQKEINEVLPDINQLGLAHLQVGLNTGTIEVEIVNTAHDSLWNSYRAACEGNAQHSYNMDPEDVDKSLRAPLPAKDTVRPIADDTVTSPQGGDALETTLLSITDIQVPECYRPFDGGDVGWMKAFTEWTSGPKTIDPPLNPEQRSIAASIYRSMAYRTIALARKDTPGQIADVLKRSADCAQLNLLIGMAGAGKSQVITHLEKQVVQDKLGRLVITAFTGAGAAVFGAATLLTLYKISIAPDDHIRDRNTVTFAKAQKLRENFRTQCGVEISDVAGIVIDEISFNTAKLIGHVDYTCRALTDEWDVPFGGLIVLLAGDNSQKRPCGGMPWYNTLVKYIMDPQSFGDTKNATHVGVTSLASARRWNLVRNMRAHRDRDFASDQEKMRDVNNANPITQAFLDSIKVLSAKDVAVDPAWAFAPIGVVSRTERDHINRLQIERFAKFFNLPLVRWRLELYNNAVLADVDDIDDIYDNEPTLWGYFVRGAPCLLTKQIKSVRRLVNTTPCLMEDLIFGEYGMPENLAAAYETGGFQIVTLDDTDRPHAVIVRVGNTKKKNPEKNDPPPYTWHGVPLDDISHTLVDFVDRKPSENNFVDNQLVPLLIGSNQNIVKLRSILAATQGVDADPVVRDFPLILAFAITDFKLQGRSLPKLIINLPNARVPPYMDVVSFYVLISRVFEREGLRWLLHDTKAQQRLTVLRHDRYLRAWNDGYDENGMFDKNLVCAAFNAKTSYKKEMKIKPTPNRKTQPPNKSENEMKRPAAQKRKAETQKNVQESKLKKVLETPPENSKLPLTSASHTFWKRTYDHRMRKMMTLFEGRILHIRAAESYIKIDDAKIHLPWGTTKNIPRYLPPQLYKLRMRIVDYLRPGNQTTSNWIISFMVWAQKNGFSVNFTRHATKKQHGNSCGIVAAFVAHTLATSTDFMNVPCDEAISSENTIAGYQNINICLNRPSDAPMIYEHDVDTAYKAHFGDQTLSIPLLLIEPYERLYLDVAQRMIAARTLGEETQLRFIVSNTHETGETGHHFFTVAYEIVYQDIE